MNYQLNDRIMLHVKLTSLSTKKLNNLPEQTIALSEQNVNRKICMR